MPANVKLRELLESDFPIFFLHQSDPGAVQMAAFTVKDPNDPIAFTAHWRKIFDDPEVTNRTILVDENIAGYISKFELFGQPEISYWIDQRYWGQGIATASLTQFLRLIPERPLFARAASDNGGSLRVLEKCGFEIQGYDTAFANARGQEIQETLLKLK